MDVLIVGGGPCGLCASIGLSRLGGRSLLVERHAGTAIHPKALHLSTRTMEVLAAWGIADDVGALALPLSDHGLFHGRSLADPDHVRHAIWPPDPDVSPQRSTLVSQEVLEPELRRHAEAGLGEVRFGVRLLGLREEADEVVAELERVADGARQEVRARYVVGADGGQSTVRAAAGIEFPGHVVHDSVNIRFRADLSELLAGRRSAFYYIQNEQVRGLLPVVDNVSDWRLHLMMADGEILDDYEDPRRRLALVRAAVGIPDFEVELLPIFGWTAAARVASSYRSGRLFLAGDSAHINPPSGGLGMNCGIQDVHNLAWKLAAVLGGAADPTLLDTYEPERRPVGLRTVAEAERNHQFESAVVHTEEERRRKHDRRRQAGIVLGEYYREGAFTPDGTEAPVVADSYVDYVPVARPGHRAPHVWLDRDGRRISSLDLIGWERPTLFVGPDAAPWREAAGDARVVTVGGSAADVSDPAGDFRTRYGIGPAGAVLVRQDGIVALRRVDAPDGPDEARRVLDTAFGPAQAVAVR